MIPRSLSRLLAASALAVLATAVAPPAPTAGQQIANQYRDVANRLIDAATANHDAYARVTELVERFGPRISGSVALERAIDWMLVEMERDGLENPRGDPVLVPHWVRGEESLEMILPWPRKLPMLGRHSCRSTRRRELR